MAEMAPAPQRGCVVTDVGSTKVLVNRWARKILPGRVQFVGSHPMAGSEQRGIDFARADLFDDAPCIITTTGQNRAEAADFLEEFWQQLGMRVTRMSAAAHDRVLARISHLPHVMAAALVNISDREEMLLCGKGFLDTTRIASGPPSIWQDVLTTNAGNMVEALEKLMRELERMRRALQSDSDKKIDAMLTNAQNKRNDLVKKKMLRKELPS